jgi:dihydroxyacetone kinase-like predicted kinase
MAEPREGTILSVIHAFALALREQADRGRDFRTGFRNALTVAREALRHTPEQLAVLRAAGVVDAGAMGSSTCSKASTTTSSRAAAC